MLLCYITANPLNPEGIPQLQLKLVWQEINVLLRYITNTKKQAQDKRGIGKEVLSADIKEAIAYVTANLGTFNTGQRMA